MSFNIASRLGQPIWLQFIRTWLHPPQTHMNFGVSSRTRSLRSAVKLTEVRKSRNTRDTRCLKLSMTFNCLGLLCRLCFGTSSHDGLFVRQQGDQGAYHENGPADPNPCG